MSTDGFQALVERELDRARAKRQILTVAHLVVRGLADHPQHADDRLVDARRRIEGALVKVAVLRPGQPDRTFDLAAAAESYGRFEGTVDAELVAAAGQAELLLAWLWRGGFDDAQPGGGGTLRAAAELCRQAGISDLDVLPPGLRASEPELGRPAGALAAKPLIGRGKDLERHLHGLGLAVQQGRHYLLEGQSGVGKSHFVQHLVELARERWAVTGDVRQRMEFRLYDRRDFSGSQADTQRKLETLYRELDQRPDVLPVLDDLHTVLDPRFGLTEEFMRLFGGRLEAGGRSFMLVCRTAEVHSSGLYRLVPQTASLSALGAEQSQRVVEMRLEELASIIPPSLKIEGGAGGYAGRVLEVARERYGHRYSPEIVLHLAESAVARARARLATEEQVDEAPALRSEDLWRHVAEELALSPELLGRTPDDFYQQVNQQLKTVVFGQDHAVDVVTLALLSLPSKAQREPRGRFLFVGPPGVGKTHLGRSLAQALGYGEEAFFIFNMSEYATEMARTRFLGSDPGYVGYGTTRTIYDLVRARSSCVVLLDEIDRSHPSIQDVLLSVLEGQGKDADGVPVSFSQAIFIMTTNQGQDRVISAYEEVQRQGGSRSQLAERFDDDALRDLILRGVVDSSESEMLDFLHRKQLAARQAFADADDDQARLTAIDQVTMLGERLRRLGRQESKPVLDRALLDRIDCIIPFFPIKERPLLARILEQELERAGWADCPPGVQEQILHAAIVQQESVRPLQRLIKKHLRERHLA